MKKEKRFGLTRFSPEVIRNGQEELWKDLPSKDTKVSVMGSLSVTVDGAKWEHDSEDEFFADYRRATGSTHYVRRRGDLALSVWCLEDDTEISVTAPSRSSIERVFAIFEGARDVCAVAARPSPPMQSPTVFIGHGKSPQWRDLKDHLQDKHDVTVTAYEIGARAGHTIRDVLEQMLEESAFAVLVMTGEDELSDGTVHPRLNVVHEAGLFQGRLGFARAIVLLEDGAQAFSNIQGLTQIRFAKGRIQETYGDVLATLRREFSSAV